MKRFTITSYLKRYWLQICLYILVGAIYTGLGIVETLLSADIIVKITDEHYLEGIYATLVLLAVTLVIRVFWWLSNFLYCKYANKIMSEINLDLANQAFKLNSKTYSDHDTGTFVQRIVGDPERVIDCLASIVDFSADIISVVVMMIYISTLNGYVTLAFVATMIIAFILEYLRIRARRKNRIETRKRSDEINSITTEIVRSEKDIKSLGLERALSDVSKNSFDRYRKARYKMDMTNVGYNISRGAVTTVGILLTMILGIYLMDLGLITLSTFMIIYSNRGSIFSFVNAVGNISNCFVDMRVSLGRMSALFDNEEFVEEKFGTKEVNNVSGDIEFRNVNFTYREYKDDENVKKTRKKHQKNRILVQEKQIFENLNFKIDRNTTVAFVGKSGSGKSTILNIMSKMYEIDSGEVLIDGINITDFNKASLRRTISLVNQFPYIFDMTIKENLRLAKEDATDEEIEDAIQRASLGEFVSGLAEGINTKVGESGIKLSGGQRQRLAIARALLRNSSIIIFDESTSSLDNFAQEEIKHTIDNLKGKSTIIIVAHRLSTIRNVDKIFFLDNGNIVDEGTFDQLFETNEKFKTMFLAENI